MYGEYTEEELDRLHQIELSILKDFDAACSNHGLTYFMESGCVIGLVRHHGFIPWDDDVDVGMPRKDFDRFVQEVVPELSDRYAFCIMDEKGSFPIQSIFMGKRGTKFVEKAFAEIPNEYGIRIDIIPYDNVPEDPKLRKKQIWHAWVWGKLYLLRLMKSPNLAFGGVKQAVIRGACYCAHWGLKILHISPAYLYHKCEKWKRLYENEDTKYLSVLDTTTPGKFVFEKDILLPPVRREFGGIMVETPRDVHAYLSLVYGDYMTPPPVEKRKNHHPYQLDFGREAE